MSAVKLSKPRIIRSRNEQPLSRAQIEPVAPAIYATEAHEARSASYAYVPTFHVLEALQEAGFGIFEAGQQRSRDSGRDPYTKHLIRLRKLDQQPIGVGGGFPEVVCVNAHDGTASYQLFGGFYRLICSNGMIVGQTLMSYRVRHTIPEVTRSEVLGASLQIVAKQYDELIDRIRMLSEVTLSTEAQQKLAAEALRLRYPDTNPPFDHRQLLDVRRMSDKADDAWTVLNRIQENVMQGGFETRSTLFARRSVVRPVERVSNVLRINQGLWDAAEKLAAIV